MLSFGLNWVWWMCTSMWFCNKPSLWRLRAVCYPLITHYEQLQCLDSVRLSVVTTSCGTYCVAGIISCCLLKGPVGGEDGSQHEMKGSGKQARCLPLLPSLWHPHSQETLQEGLWRPAPPPVSNIHHHSVCCHLHCTYSNERAGDLLFRIGSTEKAIMHLNNGFEVA